MRKQQVETGWKGKKDPHKNRKKSFLKRTICKTRSLKPDYGATMTQSLMFIPVIRCEEEDLYFIVVVRDVLRLPCVYFCLPASLGNILLLRPGIIPAWGNTDAFSQLLISPIMVQVLQVIPPEGKFLQSSVKLPLQRLSPQTVLGLSGWIGCRMSPWLLDSPPSLSWIVLDWHNCL